MSLVAMPSTTWRKSIANLSGMTPLPLIDRIPHRVAVDHMYPLRRQRLEIGEQSPATSRRRCSRWRRSRSEMVMASVRDSPVRVVSSRNSRSVVAMIRPQREGQIA